MFARRVAFDIQQEEVPMWALSSEDCQTYFHDKAQCFTLRNLTDSGAGMAHASNRGSSLGSALMMCQGFSFSKSLATIVFRSYLSGVRACQISENFLNDQHLVLHSPESPESLWVVRSLCAMLGIRYEKFRWDDAFAADWSWPAGGVAVYLAIVLVLSLGMKNARPFELGSVAVVHNLLLSVGSLVMLLGTLFELNRRWASSGDLGWFFCEASTTESNGPLFFWSYVYYLSKYYEMFDTVLVLLQKSRVPHFKLQVYHHAAVVPQLQALLNPFEGEAVSLVLLLVFAAEHRSLS